MSWSVGYDTKWKRDIGYGVPAWCDHPGCGKEIDRGLSHVCGSQPYGGDHGCGLYFCEEHKKFTDHGRLCFRCEKGEKPFEATGDHPEWVDHKLSDPSWKTWRKENREEVRRMREQRRREGNPVGQ